MVLKALPRLRPESLEVFELLLHQYPDLAYWFWPAVSYAAVCRETAVAGGPGSGSELEDDYVPIPDNIFAPFEPEGPRFARRGKAAG